MSNCYKNISRPQNRWPNLGNCHFVNCLYNIVVAFNRPQSLQLLVIEADDPNGLCTFPYKHVNTFLLLAMDFYLITPNVI